MSFYINDISHIECLDNFLYKHSMTISRTLVNSIYYFKNHEQYNQTVLRDSTLRLLVHIVYYFQICHVIFGNVLIKNINIC